ncbi:unnamed protein product [Cladocopium goreaui]|uniref:RING-type domain-containing protein n=1 Tax=Cladocopium goreaui TaxID=2562237 RepID=A0A9P1GL24_9DINO|nr:unnamed protein product [Cladocopium goreaui]
MPSSIRCEKVQTHVVQANGEPHPVVVYQLGHFSSRPAIQVSRGQWMVAVHFGAVQSLDQHLTTTAERLKVPGATPLWHFAPYRIGADQRADVIAERSLGLCKYLEHVLKFTEVPAPKDLVQIFDDFVTRYWVGNLERTLRAATSIAVRTPPTPRTAGKLAMSQVLGRVRPGQQMQDPPIEMPSLRAAMQRFKALQAAGTNLASSELLSAARPLGGAVATQPHAKPFIEVVPASKVPQDACPLCKRHLRQKETGCIRLRSCGHALHGECFNALMSASNRFPGVPRTGCPKCGECWADWAKLENQSHQTTLAEGAVCANAERQKLSTLLGLGMSSRATWGQHER